MEDPHTASVALVSMLAYVTKYLPADLEHASQLFLRS